MRHLFTMSMRSCAQTNKETPKRRRKNNAKIKITRTNSIGFVHGPLSGQPRAAIMGVSFQENSVRKSKKDNAVFVTESEARPKEDAQNSPFT